MSRQVILRAALAAASLFGASLAAGAGESPPPGDDDADRAFSIDVDAIGTAGCFGNAFCNLGEATIATTGGVLEKKKLNGAAGFGVSGGPSGGEIDIGENLRIDFDQSRSIIAIKILFLYNGPEFGDRAEVARVSADGTGYTLTVRNDADDATADWTGPGTVTRCGATTAGGTGCFLITDPFPGAVSRLDFTAVAGGQPFPPSGGTGTSESDYAIGHIDVAADVAVDLDNCASLAGCPVASVGGNVAASINSVEAENAGGSDEAIVLPVRLPDCRYIPQACLALLPPAGDSAASDDAARAILIGLGVIKSLDPSGPNRLNPAAQLLNVRPLLPPEVTSLFDASGTPPNGLPLLYVSSRWRAQEGNGFWFDGLFFKADARLIFSETFEGLIDVSALTGDELGCVADIGDLLAWDVITTVSELAKSIGGRHVDTMINVGCVNPTKVSGTRLSLFAVNLEMVDDTFGPTIKSSKPVVTVDNDAVFARLVQSLWSDLGEVRASYACKQVDPLPSGGPAPLSRRNCDKLASYWSVADLKLKLCVNATFHPASSYRTWICDRARSTIDEFEAALPATATGPDAFNRLGELKSRVDVIQHVWDERFVNSLKPGGFCRERGACRP